MTTAGSLPVPNNWINDKFGSKRGLLNSTLFEIKRMAGNYSSLKVPKEAQPKRLVFVCVGNICRSPLAEAVATSRGFSSISYGLSTRGNDTADKRAVKFAEKQGLDLKSHRTRRIEDYCEREGDLIIGMEPKHLDHIFDRNYRAQRTLLGLYGDNKLAYIHDPYNTNDCFFTHCENLVLKSTECLLNHVK